MTPNSGTLAAGVDSEMLKLSLNRLAPTWPYLKALCGSSPGLRGWLVVEREESQTSIALSAFVVV